MTTCAPSATSGLRRKQPGGQRGSRGNAAAARLHDKEAPWPVGGAGARDRGGARGIPPRPGPGPPVRARDLHKDQARLQTSPAVFGPRGLPACRLDRDFCEVFNTHVRFFLGRRKTHQYGGMPLDVARPGRPGRARGVQLNRTSAEDAIAALALQGLRAVLAQRLYARWGLSGGRQSVPR